MADVASTGGNFQLSEEAQRSAPQQLEGQGKRTLGEGAQLNSESVPKVVPPAGVETPTNPLLFRTSTPTQDLTRASTELNLTQLETGLTIAPSSRTTLPELLPVANPATKISAVSFLQTETDDGSSSCDAPRLPTGEAKVRFLDDSTGAEETGDTSSQASGPPLYGFVPPSAANAKTGEDSSSEVFAHIPDPSQPSTSAPHDTAIRELSGRSRAILKQYFDEDASTISFPLGHRTVAFTEPQVYHLLRVLTDETLKMSYEAMERMVIGAVKGAPVTSESRNGHFKLRRRAQTPGPGQQEKSSDSSQDATHFGFGTDTSEEVSTDKEVREMDFLNDSDSSGEIILISQAFKESSGTGPVTREAVNTNPNNEGFESAGQSSLDATLSELRDQTTPVEPPAPSSSKQPKKKKRGHTRGVPMKEEFSKIGWTRSFISGPADPLHNPYMVWCHICKKNISIKTKGTLVILRHHRNEKHLRRDQRWRYEHLRSVQPVTGKVQHRVRGRNGKIITKIELAKELPKFIDAELVDIGERFPFYDDFVKGTSTTLVTPESRAKTQIT